MDLLTLNPLMTVEIITPDMFIDRFSRSPNESVINGGFSNTPSIQAGV
ncbi:MULTISPECIES: hypothetical protein [unclassified Microcoleus]